MSDVLEVLNSLPDTMASRPTRPETIAADLARGHRALIRRRRRRIGTRAGSVLAAAAVVVTATHLAQSAGPAQSSATGTNAQSPGHAQVRLVAYSGAQPAGFTVSTVPAGWQVVSSTQYDFVVAPPGSTATPDPHGSISLADQIVVMLKGASWLPADSPTSTVSINGRDGKLGRADTATKPGAVTLTPTGPKWLIFPDAAGNQVLVQVPDSVGLTDDQIVSFARGITVTSDAHAAGG